MDGRYTITAPVTADGPDGMPRAFAAGDVVTTADILPGCLESLILRHRAVPVAADQPAAAAPAPAAAPPQPGPTVSVGPPPDPEPEVEPEPKHPKHKRR